MQQWWIFNDKTIPNDQAHRYDDNEKKNQHLTFDLLKL